MSARRKARPDTGRIIELWGPVADPAPWFHRWRELFTQEQQVAVLVKEIDMKIRNTQFAIESLNFELENLESMKSMIKIKGR